MNMRSAIIRSAIIFIVAAVALAGIPQPSVAAVPINVGINVQQPPPPIPYYVQPYAPGANYIFEPGYWSWASGGYYWVPGTWVHAPQPGLLWTPGYWGWTGSGFGWNAGYWAPQVGYYGGINYGSGYFGKGYNGGRWRGHHFYYNTYVTNVNVNRVRNVYVDRTVYVNRSSHRVSYVGGRGGLNIRPTAAQRETAHGRRYGMTPAQRAYVQNAAHDREHFYSENHGRPAQAAASRPTAHRATPQQHRATLQHHRATPQQHRATLQQHRATPQQHRATPPQQRSGNSAKKKQHDGNH